MAFIGSGFFTLMQLLLPLSVFISVYKYTKKASYLLRFLCLADMGSDTNPVAGKSLS